MSAMLLLLLGSGPSIRLCTCREMLAARAAALEETVAETRAERGQLENYKQLTRETEAAKVRR